MARELSNSLLGFAKFLSTSPPFILFLLTFTTTPLLGLLPVSSPTLLSAL
jgi:hypothetical protein